MHRPRYRTVLAFAGVSSIPFTLRARTRDMVIEAPSGSKVAGLAAIEKFYVDLLYALADAARGSRP